MNIKIGKINIGTQNKNKKIFETLELKIYGRYLIKSSNGVDEITIMDISPDNKYIKISCSSPQNYGWRLIESMNFICELKHI
jgi:hypothetical protein